MPIIIIFILMIISTTVYSSNKTNNSGSDDDKKVFLTAIGGIQVQPSSYPFIAAFRFEDQFRCSGIILSKNQILTVAHCFNKDTPKKGFTVHIGRMKRTGPREANEQVFGISRVVAHRQFVPQGNTNPRRKTMDNDVALVWLNGSISYNANVSRAILPSPYADLPANTYCCVVGWGETLGFGDPNVLNEICMATWDRKKCNADKFHDGRLSHNMICAGEESGAIDSCSGDSGGPMVCKKGQEVQKVWGLVSWGIGCAEANKPGVYTNLANYLKWIQANQ